MSDVAEAPVASSSETAKKLLSIQILRFYAAGIVVLAHLGDRLEGFAERYHVPVDFIEITGAFGVDIFFVISGFIMGYIALDRFGRAGAPVAFLLDRATRIVPLYWVATLLMVVLNELANRLGDPAKVQPQHLSQIIMSLSFFPFPDARGEHRPVLGQGWSLDYEMLFYLLFAFCLVCRRRLGILLLALLFCILGALHMVANLPFAAQVWTDPIIFEFLFGFLLAVLQRHLRFAWPTR
jgi:peptidoglycan/LPS O-acetylase OafA/YrhL